MTVWRDLQLVESMNVEPQIGSDRICRGPTVSSRRIFDCTGVTLAFVHGSAVIG